MLPRRKWPWRTQTARRAAWSRRRHVFGNIRPRRSRSGTGSATIKADARDQNNVCRQLPAAGTYPVRRGRPSYAPTLSLHFRKSPSSLLYAVDVVRPHVVRVGRLRGDELRARLAAGVHVAVVLRCGGIAWPSDSATRMGRSRPPTACRPIPHPRRRFPALRRRQPRAHRPPADEASKVLVPLEDRGVDPLWIGQEHAGALGGDPPDSATGAVGQAGLGEVGHCPMDTTRHEADPLPHSLPLKHRVSAWSGSDRSKVTLGRQVVSACLTCFDTRRVVVRPANTLASGCPSIAGCGPSKAALLVFD